MAQLASGLSSDDLSQLSVPNKNAEQTKAPAAISPTMLVERVNRAGQALAQTIQSSESKLASAMRLPGNEKFDELFAFVAAISSHVKATVTSINSLSPDSPDRQKIIGETMMPFAITYWERKPPSDDAAFLYEVYRRTHIDQESGRTDIGGQPWVKAIMPQLTVMQTGTALPTAGDYLTRSQSAKTQYMGIKTQMDEIEGRIFDQTRSNQASLDNGKPPQFIEQVALNREKLSKLKDRIIPIFDQASDVTLDLVPEAYNSINVRVAPNAQFNAALRHTTDSLEKIVHLATWAGQGKRIDSFPPLFVPQFSADGVTRVQQVPVTAEDLKAIGENPHRLTKALNALRMAREALLSIHDSLVETPQLEGGELGKIRDLLRDPFTNLPRGDKTMRLLVSHKEDTVSQSGARILTAPVFTNKETNNRIHILETPRAFDLLTSIAGKALRSNVDVKDPYQQVLAAHPHLAERGLGLVSHCAKLAREVLVGKGSVGDLARFIDERLEAASTTEDHFESLTLLSVLSALSKDEEFSRPLRHQIPHLRSAKDISQRRMSHNPELTSVLPEVFHDIICTLSHSMSDYYLEEGTEELQDLVKNFRYFLKHPNCLEGVKGNEGIRNAMAIFGGPGTGKTFFADCLVNEFDVNRVVLSPGDKKETEDRLAYTKRIIEEVKAAKEPSLLIIDEAETTVVDRMCPIATSEDRERTNYLLQAVNDLRIGFPQIFILLASNYPERVDPAMLRPGRIDLQVDLLAPSGPVRELHILATLKKEKIAIDLSPKEMNRLVTLSDSWVPLQIIQTITETNRLYVPRLREERDEDIVLNFELLESRFEQRAKADAKTRKIEPKVKVTDHTA